jgi:hypothetical protein
MRSVYRLCFPAIVDDVVPTRSVYRRCYSLCLISYAPRDKFWESAQNRQASFLAYAFNESFAIILPCDVMGARTGRHIIRYQMATAEAISHRSGRDATLRFRLRRRRAGSGPEFRVSSGSCWQCCQWPYCICSLSGLINVDMLAELTRSTIQDKKGSIMKNDVFWVVTPCGSCKNRRTLRRDTKWYLFAAYVGS